MTVRKAFLLAAAALGCLFLLAGGVAAWPQQFDIPKSLPELRLPMLITSCGQSPGGVYVNVICRSLKYDADFIDMADVTTLAGSKQYRTLLVTTGTSLKGMGSAGVEIAAEVRRCEALVKKAKASGITVIVAQIEGPSRRVDETDEESIRSMTPLANMLITRADVNKDGYFTKTAAELKIPQVFIKQQLELQKLFPLIFKTP
jgi:hypothetical protein